MTLNSLLTLLTPPLSDRTKVAQFPVFCHARNQIHRLIYAMQSPYKLRKTLDLPILYIEPHYVE